MSTRALAKAAQVSPTYVSQVERGGIKVPSLRVLKEFARVLHLDLSELIAATGEEDVANLEMPPDSRLAAISKQLMYNPDLANIAEVWPTLTEVERQAIAQAVSDLAELRHLIESAREAVGEKATDSESLERAE